MSEQSRRNRVRERAKLGVRSGLARLNLDLVRDPYPNRLTRALAAHSVTGVLDVGANVGQYATALRRAGYSGRILSVEPLSGAYEQLCARAAGDPEWTPLHVALGAEPGNAEINVSANSYSSSLLAITERHVSAAPRSRVIGTESVQVKTVAGLIAEQGWRPESTMLKIDTQGFEDAVLDGAGDLLGRFAAVQLELSFVELYAGQRLFHELVARMRANGLEIYALEPGFSDESGRMLQCDGLFFREADHD